MIGGVTYAYFTGKNLVQGEGASLSATTVTIEDVGLSVEGTLTFNDENIWPGHQDISAIRVTAYGENLVTYNLIWEGTSTISTAPLKYYVYKANTEEKPKVTCTKKKSGSVNFRKYYEECTKEGFENLGEIVQKGEINNSKVILKSNEAIKGTEQGTSVYYYVIVEFPNEGDNQNEDFGHNFEGKVTVEETKDDLADITIAKISKINNGVEEEIDKQPDKNEGYTLDLTKSNCDKDATLNWNDNSYSLKVNVKQTGTKCDLVFKPKPTAKDTLADLYKDSLTVSENTSKCPVVDQTTGQASSAINFPSVESGTLLCKGYDDDGETYYFRGMAEKNWVKIDNTYWRIIRINGNGSLRLIFSGNGSVQTTGIGTMIILMPMK